MLQVTGILYKLLIFLVSEIVPIIFCDAFVVLTLVRVEMLFERLRLKALFM